MLIDASVILKWFLDEDDSDKAKVIKDGHISGDFTVVIPDIAIYEIGNALRYASEFSIDDVNRSIEELYELSLDIIAPLPDICNVATEIAYQNNITFYDAFYIALAKELELQFFTADAKLYEKTKHLPFVKLLSKLEFTP